MENYISLKGICFSYYGKVSALNNVNLDVKKGDLFCIIGQNGSGKSTMLHVINALIFPDSGEYMFNGIPITEKYLKDTKNNVDFRKHFGYIFQNSDIQLFCPSVFDELLFGPLQLNISRDEAEQRASETMKYIGIENLKDRSVLSLSGGEKKKVAIASILTMNPEVILIDEPLAGLDPKTQTFFTEMMIELQRIGKTIIFTSHNLELIDHLQPRVAVISERHSIMKVGTTTDILGDEELLKSVNLLHEHTHVHGNKTHRHYHSHYVFHKHD